MPGTKQVIVACSSPGMGSSSCQIVGEIIADLATDGGTSHPIALFDPLRFTPTGEGLW